MIHFMLDTNGAQTFGLLFDGIAIQVLSAQSDLCVALNGRVVVRDRQTSLVPSDAAFAVADLGIDDHARVFAYFFVAPLGIDYEHADRGANLGRGETDARLVVHDFDHVAGELADLFGHFRDRFGNQLEAGVWEMENFSKGHESVSYAGAKAKRFWPPGFVCLGRGKGSQK